MQSDFVNYGGIMQSDVCASDNYNSAAIDTHKHTQHSKLKTK